MMDKYNLRLNVPIRLTLQCYHRDLSGVCKHMNGELSRIVQPCNATEFCLGCENQRTEKCPDGELTVIRLWLYMMQV